MDKFWSNKRESLPWIIGAVLIGVVLLATIGRPLFRTKPVSKTGEGALKEFPHITVGELASKVQQGSPLLILDARPVDQYLTEHIPNAASASPETIDERLAGISRDMPIVTVGNNYAEAQGIAVLLDTRGYKNISVLVGGMTAWQDNSGTTVSWGDPTSFSDLAKVKFTTTEEARKNQTNRPQYILFLDVRTRDEFDASHVTGAINVPLDELESNTSGIARGKEVIVYGASELQGFQAAVKLSDLGYISVKALSGTFDGWKQKGFPIESTPDPNRPR
ncbi:hypothetical protein EPO05_03505 [Patescibacteria group bacterium]|nr:MAG: hypothetical protein EPO05_03505 [Patescibacteria group bacterium]